MRVWFFMLSFKMSPSAPFPARLWSGFQFKVQPHEGPKRKDERSMSLKGLREDCLEIEIGTAPK